MASGFNNQEFRRTLTTVAKGFGGLLDPKTEEKIVDTLDLTMEDSEKLVGLMEKVVEAADAAKRRFERADTGEGFPRGSVSWAMHDDLKDSIEALEKAKRDLTKTSK